MRHLILLLWLVGITAVSGCSTKKPHTPGLPFHRHVCETTGVQPSWSVVICTGEAVKVKTLRGAASGDEVRSNLAICHRRDAEGELESVVLEGGCLPYSVTTLQDRAMLSTLFRMKISCPFPSGAMDLRVAFGHGQETKLELGGCQEVRRLGPAFVTPAPERPPRSDSK